MIAELEEKIKEVLNHDALSAICKLAGIGEALLPGDKYPLELTTTLNSNSNWSLWVRIKKLSLPRTGALDHAEYHHDLAQFSLSELPGDGDVLVSHSASVHEYYRRRGIGRLLNAYRIEAAHKAGVSAILATVRADNEGERKILFEQGWTPNGGYTYAYADAAGFVPDRHRVEFWIKELRA